MSKTFQNLDVLNFYRELPFNIYSNKEAAITNLKQNNLEKIYPPLSYIIKNYEGFSALDLGCGAGWFANSMAYKYNKIKIVGVDFNSVAIDFAKKVKDQLNLKTNFIVEDLFQVNFNTKFDLISSIGVLHHTNNCLEGIKKIIDMSPKYFLIGLYHKYGWIPFVDLFDNLKLIFQIYEINNF